MVAFMDRLWASQGPFKDSLYDVPKDVPKVAPKDAPKDVSVEQMSPTCSDLFTTILSYCSLFSNNLFIFEPSTRLSIIVDSCSNYISPLPSQYQFLKKPPVKKLNLFFLSSYRYRYSLFVTRSTPSLLRHFAKLHSRENTVRHACLTCYFFLETQLPQLITIKRILIFSHLSRPNI